MTPDLDALAALLAAATPGPIEGCECACHGIDTIADICRHCGPYQEAATLQVAAVNALPALIEAARREAGLREAIRAIPRLRLTGEQLDSIAPPPQGAEHFSVDWDEYDDFVPGTMLDALLHANAGTTAPAEGTE